MEMSMNKKDFLLNLDELLGLNAGTLTGEESLQDLTAWDSLAVLGFIALVDKELKISLSPAAIDKAKTVEDLLQLLGDKIQ